MDSLRTILEDDLSRSYDILLREKTMNDRNFSVRIPLQKFSAETQSALV